MNLHGGRSDDGDEIGDARGIVVVRHERAGHEWRQRTDDAARPFRRDEVWTLMLLTDEDTDGVRSARHGEPRVRKRPHAADLDPHGRGHQDALPLPRDSGTAAAARIRDAFEIRRPSIRSV